MSYPKKHPQTTQSQVGGTAPSQYGKASNVGSAGGAGFKDERFSKRREQLQQLLVNKFRGKYLSGSASIEEENNVDRVIKAEVSRFLEHEQMTEANLVRLDARLSDVLQTRNSTYGGGAIGRGNSRGSNIYDDAGNYATSDSRGSRRGIPLPFNQNGLKPLSQASQRSRSSAIKDVGNQILQSPTGAASHQFNSPSKDPDYWTKIIMHNVEQFQKEKDAVKARIRENQQRMKEELQKQMTDHRVAKQEAKKNDLDYFEVIRKNKEDLAREEREKKERIQRLVEEQKLVRDRQIEEHNLLKHLERKQKREDNEKLKQISNELQIEKMIDKEKLREKKEKTLNVYTNQIQLRHEIDAKDHAELKMGSQGNNMLNQLFEQKRNVAKEMMAVKERRIELIQEKMHTTGGGLAASGDESRLRDYMSRTEQQAREMDRQQAIKEERKKMEKKMKEAETKAYLDQQVAAKLEKKDFDKRNEDRIAKFVQADVQAFEKSKNENKIEHRTKMNAHLESLVKQIDENKSVPKGAPRTAKIGMSLAEQELLINKKLIEDVENGAQMPGQPGTIKRPF